MTDYRDQAIRDVAEASGLSVEGIERRLERPDNWPTTAYAVTQGERALELEAFLEKVVNVNAASTEPDWAELSDALGGLAYDAMKLQAQLQQKEGEHGTENG